MERLKVFTDGASRGNPGEAGFGVVIQDSKGTQIEEVSGYLGKATNNVAEYSALIAALKAVTKYGNVPVDIYSDSELLVKQLHGLYQVKSTGLLPLFKEAKRLMEQLRKVTLTHIPREKNSEADALANRVLNRRAK